MHIFIDTISPDGILILFENNDIIDSLDLDIKGKESNEFLLKLEELVNRNNINFKDISGIVIINGPGSFTGTRVISLIVNTINFVHHTPLSSINYFELLEYMENGYPMAIKANKGEYLIKKSKASNPEIIAIPELPKGDYFGIGDNIDFEKNESRIQLKKDYKKFIKEFEFNGKNHRIEPFYIKKPNIT
ncbi:hypothetical protein M0P65_03495 [Candidatus Gracilibacteria bacterium]|nr:hypothetical protein [Candidatus Gracilibacteria bacterium]